MLILMLLANLRWALNGGNGNATSSEQGVKFIRFKAQVHQTARKDSSDSSVERGPAAATLSSTIFEATTGAARSFACSARVLVATKACASSNEHPLSAASA